MAIARRARSDPIPLANATRSKEEAQMVVKTLQNRRAQLLKEVKDINVTLSFVKITFK